MLIASVCAPTGPGAPARPAVTVVGSWRIEVSPGVLRIGRRTWRVSAPTQLEVPAATVVQVRDERLGPLPLLDEREAPWARGVRLHDLITFETTAPDILVPESVVLKASSGAGQRLASGVDYVLEPRWATVARLPKGSIAAEQVLYADYTLGLGRIDSVVLGARGAVSLRQGAPHNATPQPPALAPGEALLANLWVPGRTVALTDASLFPVLEPAYAAPRHKSPPAAALLPRTWHKLASGQPLHVLAWGDSVTAGGQASDEAHRWQNQFVDMLRRQFPRASIRLTTAGWGGRNSDSFLNEPPDSPYNFERAVVQPHPDLVVMEFVNDAWMTPDDVERKYSYLLERLKAAGAEWAILTPHLVWPEWMGLHTAKVEEDPRPYVAGVRAFAQKHGVALADASLRWCHLAREGIPYVTLLSNSLNHPDDRGHRLFALSLMELFGKR